MISAFSVYDVKAKKYAHPMFFENEDLAVRSMQAAMVPGSLLLLFPADFELWYIGEFDDEKGELFNAGEYDLLPKHMICRAIDLKGEEE